MQYLSSRLSNFLAVAIVGFVCLQSQGANYVQGSIERVIDGDTVWVQQGVSWSNPLSLSPSLDQLDDDLNSSARLKIRMLGIDAPESHLPTNTFGVVGQGHFGNDSAQYLQRLLKKGQRVSIEDRGLDKYNRTLGRVFVGNTDVHIQLLQAGAVTTFILCDERECSEEFFTEHRVNYYIQACRDAQSRGYGIWNPSDPLTEMPYDFRARMQEREPTRLIGNYLTRTYYGPRDAAKVPICDRVFFPTEREAARAGFHRG